MKMSVSGNREVKRKAGDIIEFDQSSHTHRDHSFYMICESQVDGFFIMSLTGKKSRIKYYDTIEALIHFQNNIKKIYSKSEWMLDLQEVK